MVTSRVNRTFRTESSISVEYIRNKDLLYALEDGTISITYDIFGPYFGKSKSYTLTLNEAVSLIYSPKEQLTLEDMRIQFGLFEDLFIILSDSEYCLRWPSLGVMVGGTKLKYKWHFSRLKNSTEAPKYHECPTNFVQIQETFGHIVSAWKNKREQFGPGFYLYLSVRRGMQLYPEHRFVTLIWGIEAFHRRKHGEPPSDAIQRKLSRIVGQVSRAKDKTWLEGRLKNALEPPWSSEYLRCLRRSRSK